MYPHERSLVQKMENKPFALLGINSDPSKDELKKVIEKEKMTWRSFWNGDKGSDGPLSRAWNVRSWPTVYVLDPQGVIRSKWVGNPGEKAIDAALEELIRQAEGNAKKVPK